MKEADRKY